MIDKGDKSLDAALEALKKSKRATADLERNTPDKARPGRGKVEPPGKGRQTGPSNAAKILGVFDVFWNGWLRPLARFLRPLTGRVWRFYQWSFRKFAYVAGDGSARVFSRKRAAIVTATLAVITIATPYVVIGHVIPTVSRAIYDAGMLVTMKEDKLFLGRAELINPEQDLFQVMGCRDISGCDGGDNTTYYRLRPNVILNVKFWATRLQPYDPAEIAGAMVSELNDCTIKYYGRRAKALGWYPYIISASCVPV